jgi:antirestriction protein ArdC
MKRDLYAEVSARIVAELERGAAPWVKPWSATAGANTPCNAVTNRPYSGCNVVLLWMAANAGYRTPRYLTFNQALERSVPSCSTLKVCRRPRKMA